MGVFKWEDIYPELVNKLRWSIATCFSTPESRFPYQDSQKIATVYAQEIIELLKVFSTEPGVLATTATIRGFSNQRVLDKIES